MGSVKESAEGRKDLTWLIPTETSSRRLYGWCLFLGCCAAGPDAEGGGADEVSDAEEVDTKECYAIGEGEDPAGV